MLYACALFSEFVSTASPTRRNLEYAYAPPHRIGFSFGQGLHVKGIRQVIHPETLGKVYEADPRRDAPLGWFVRGDRLQTLGRPPDGTPFLRHRLDRLEIPEGLSPEDFAFHFLGADQYGRDLYSRLITGARISLSVGLVGIAVTFVLGMLFGGVSGYLGGKVDTVVQRGIEIINAFPSMPMWLALGAAIPTDWSPLRGYFMITIVLSFLSWTGLARVIRGKILSLREEDYAMAARLLGASNGRIIFRHLLPGFTSHIIVSLTLAIPGMVLAETSLSFLGLGLRPPLVSWGVLLQDCMDIKAVTDYPWLMSPVSPSSSPCSASTSSATASATRPIPTSMELKHKECFCPAFVNHFGLQAVSRAARETWDFVNLYSIHRGLNRFKAVLEALRLLNARPEVRRQLGRETDTTELADWLASEKRHSEMSLGLYVRDHRHELSADSLLVRCLQWSMDVAEAVRRIVHDLPPMAEAVAALEALQGRADVLVVSQTPAADLVREWAEHGITRLTRMIAGQEQGTKEEHLALAAGTKYPPGHVLMVGDAPGDFRAAEANGFLFFPIVPGAERASWEEFRGVGLARFFDGSFAGAYQRERLAAFHRSLPEQPPWQA
jgi:peptide/nickel transport system permease protein